MPNLMGDGTMTHSNSASFACWAIIFLTAIMPQKSNATTFFEESFVCPIGGEEFTASVVGSNTTFGARPDGRPYSPLPVYPITECPGNGFLIFKEDWTTEELTTLTSAIEMPEFDRIRLEETQYYRLWWLSEKIGVSARLLAEHLMVASWETDHESARKARYQQAFADAVAQLDPADDPESWFWLNLRAANARRELGQFEAATSLFVTAEQSLSIISDEEEREYVTQFIAGQRQLILERNAASEPANLIPADTAPFRCVLGSEELTGIELPICQSPEVQNRISRMEATTEDGRSLTGADAIRYLAEVIERGW